MNNAESMPAHLRKLGLLLQQDKRLPDVATTMAGEPIRGSWWAHPRAQAIFASLGELEQHPDTLVTKLIAGKVTFIHRQLWPAVLAVAGARDSWQFAGLTAEARELYLAVEQQRMLMAAGRTAKELERRLLVHSAQVHTESGHHELSLECWELWAERVNLETAISVQMGRQQIKSAVLALGGTAALLPWTS